MTNEQLKILLLNISARLEAAAAQADEELDDAQRHIRQRYIGKSIIPPFLEPKNADEWEDVQEGVIALDPIYSVIDDIKTQAEVLGGQLLETD